MAHSNQADDYVQGATAIASFLGPSWTPRQVFHARETGALPIRKKRGIGIYAFKSELVAGLRDPTTLPRNHTTICGPR